MCVLQAGAGRCGHEQAARTPGGARGRRAPGRGRTCRCRWGPSPAPSGRAAPQMSAPSPALSRPARSAQPCKKHNCISRRVFGIPQVASFSLGASDNPDKPIGPLDKSAGLGKKGHLSTCPHKKIPHLWDQYETLQKGVNFDSATAPTCSNPNSSSAPTADLAAYTDWRRNTEIGDQCCRMARTGGI